ncbi:MAG: TIGR02147 family protein [Pseudobdellovibrionaceae bacterium]
MLEPQELLKSELQKRKARNPHFSMRSFAKWLNMSPAQLSQMISGKRPVTLKTLEKLSSKLDLTPNEKRDLLYSKFEKENSKTSIERLQLAEDQFRLISDWYHLAILSLTHLKGAKSDPRWIGQRLGISVEQAHQALLRLQRLALIETSPQFKQIGNPFEVSSQTPSEAIQKYHQQNLSLAAEKLETVAPSLRQYQSVSLTLDPQSLKSFKRLIDAFLDDAYDLAKKSSKKEVYNLNVQLFPVTQPKDPI